MAHDRNVFIGNAHGLLEDLRVWLLNCFLHLSLCGLGSHDSVLSRLLLLHLLSEFAFNTLIIVDSFLKLPVHPAHLWRVSGTAAFAIALDLFEFVAQIAIRGHDLCIPAVDIGVGGTIVEDAAVEALEVYQLRLEVVDSLVNGLTLVQDVVAIAAATAAHTLGTIVGLHLYLRFYSLSAG